MTLLNWEIAAYSASTGQIEIWVQIPTLSSSANTTIYMWYNNSSVSTYQCTATSTWDSNYEAVYHFGTSSSLSLHDSTSNGYTLTNTNSCATAASGQTILEFGVQTNSQLQSLVATSGALALYPPYALTLSAWLRPQQTDGAVTFSVSQIIPQELRINGMAGICRIPVAIGIFEAANNNSFGTSVSGAAITAGTAQYVACVATSATSRAPSM